MQSLTAVFAKFFRAIAGLFLISRIETGLYPTTSGRNIEVLSHKILRSFYI